MSSEPEAIARRLTTIRERIREACEASGRNPEGVRLVGACKRQPAARLTAARDAGLRIFGENIVQEALAHQELLTSGVEWHLIGPLQSNKASKAVRAFSWIHSIDRPKIARVLERAAGVAETTIHGFLEVNLGEEPSKHGFSPHELVPAAEPMAGYEKLSIEGLMAIPPFEEDPAASRRWFRRLRELRDELFSREPWSDRPGFLSMGMSADFAIAVEEGATHVRIGTSLFGPRDSKGMA